MVGIISNGYPHRSLGELGLENKYQAFYATKMALWCYLIPSWDISNLKVAPGLSGDELDRGNRILPPPRTFTSGARPTTICSRPE